MREATYTYLDHPEWIDGRRLWKDASIKDICDRLQNGDPTRGWEGDPRLALYYDAPGSRWELWRLEADNEYRMVARSKPHAALTLQIIDELVKRDVRRGFDLKLEIDSHNASRRRSRSAEFQSWLDEEIRPHMSYLVGKGRVHRGSE